MTKTRIPRIQWCPPPGTGAKPPTKSQPKKKKRKKKTGENYYNIICNLEKKKNIEELLFLLHISILCQKRYRFPENLQLLPKDFDFFFFFFRLSITTKMQKLLLYLSEYRIDIYLEGPYIALCLRYKIKKKKNRYN